MRVSKEELFADLNGKRVSVDLSGTGFYFLSGMTKILITPDEEMCSNNDLLGVEWDEAEIEKEDKDYIITIHGAEIKLAP